MTKQGLRATTVIPNKGYGITLVRMTRLHPCMHACSCDVPEYGSERNLPQLGPNSEHPQPFKQCVLTHATESEIHGHKVRHMSNLLEICK